MSLIVNDEFKLKQLVHPCPDMATAKKIIEKLEVELAKHKNGIGLAANQISIPMKVCIIRKPNLHLDLINPKIIFQQHPVIFPNEACLSFPGRTVNTLRYRHITIQNDGKKILKFKELSDAVCVQHEIDHTQGLTIFDRAFRDF